MKLHLSVIPRSALVSVGILLLSLPPTASGQSASSTRTYGSSQPAQQRPAFPGRYRGQGAYRSQTPKHQNFTPNRRLPRAQPGSLLPGDFGYGYRQSPSPHSDYRPSYPNRGERRRYGYTAPGYVVYVPSSGYSNGFPDDGYAAQPLEDARSQQPIYIVVQAPESQPRIVERAPSPAPPVPVTAPQLPPAPARPVSREPGEVQMLIQPADAVVLLDDRRLGTAAELESFDSTVTLSPGVYVLEVTHSELQAQRLIFDVQPGKPVLVEVNLLAEKANRRTRLTTPDDLPLFLGKR